MAERHGCARHLPIIAGLFLLALVLVLVTNRGAVERAIENAQAMNEGATEARALGHPDSLLAYLARHPERASLVVFDVEQPEAGIYYRADVPRPVIGLPVLLALAEYARQVEAETLHPDTRLPAERLEQARLPVRRGEPESPDPEPRLRLDEVAERAVRRRDAAAADVLLEHLGHDAVEAVPERLGLAGTEPPLPMAGLYLAWGDTTAGTPADRIAAYAAEPRGRFRERVLEAATRYRSDHRYREAERERLSLYGFQMGLPEQRALAAATLPQGAAADYAALLAAALRDSLFSPAASDRFRGLLERPIPDSVRAEVEALASAGSAFPGIVSFAGYARRNDGTGRVVVLLLEELPMAVFYHLAQTGVDAAFELALLSNDAYFEQVRAVLQAHS